jgi:DNA-binding transcriptional LysR family regulator
MLGLSGEMTGILRVSSSPAIAQFALAALIPKFLSQNPKVQVRLDVTNRYVDLFGESYDVGLRAHASPLKDSSLLQRVVAHTPWALAASPDYLKANPPPATPSDLAAHQVLYFLTGRADPAWLFRQGDDSFKVSLVPSLCSDDMASLRLAAMGGAGIVGLPTYILNSAIEVGRLVPLLADWRLAGSSISIVTPPRRQSSRLTKFFTDFVAAEMHLVAMA